MRVMAVCAHPDDAEILVGGTLAKYRKRNDEVFIVVATNGAMGHPTLPPAEIAQLRQQEAQNAAALIGAKLIWLGFPDEFMYDTPENRLVMINAFRQCRPDVVLTHWPGDLYNPDHTVTGQMANDVAIMTTVPNIETNMPPCEKIPVVYFMDSMAGVGFIPEEYVDITVEMETKQRMLAEHRSQVSDWLVNQYNVSMAELVDIGNRYRGIQSGVRYAEGFLRAKAWPRGIAGTLLP